MNSDAGLGGRNVFERNVFVLVLNVDKNGVALIECTATGVLTRKADRNTVLDQARKGESFGHAVVHRSFAGAHLSPLLQQLLYLGMNVESFRVHAEAITQVGKFLG